MSRRLFSLFSLAAIVVSFGACAGSPTEPRQACARASAAAACPVADYANPKI